MRRPLSGRWRFAPMFSDPPPPPKGYRGAAEYSAYMGLMERYRVVVDDPDAAAMAHIEGCIARHWEISDT